MDLDLGKRMQDKILQVDLSKIHVADAQLSFQNVVHCSLLLDSCQRLPLELHHIGHNLKYNHKLVVRFVPLVIDHNPGYKS